MDTHLKRHLNRYGILDIIMNMDRQEEHQPFHISIEVVGTKEVCSKLYFNGVIKIGLIPGIILFPLSLKMRQAKVLPVEMVSDRVKSTVKLSEHVTLSEII